MVVVEEYQQSECDDVESIASIFSEDGDDLEYEFTDNDLITYEGKIMACLLIGCVFIAVITCMGIYAVAEKEKDKQLRAIASPE